MISMNERGYRATIFAEETGPAVIRVEPDRLADRRPVIHNYGHGGAGFTVSWGCAANVLAYAEIASNDA
jgi:hypothetical protein